MAKTAHSTTGQSAEATSLHGVTYYAEFAAGVSGSAQLQMRVNGDWLPAATAVTATSTLVGVLPNDVGGAAVSYRWTITAIAAGTITTYLQ